MTAAEALSDGRAGYLEAVETLLVAAVPCDVALYNVSDVATGVTTVAGRFAHEYRWAEPLVKAFAREHPVIQAFVRPSRRAPVCRVSDEVDSGAFVQSHIFSDLYRPMGVRYQAAVLTASTIYSPSAHPSTQRRICGWVLNRSSFDFSDADLELLAVLERSLAALDAVVHPSLTTSDQQRLAPRIPPLTPRELEVLGLLSQGFTASRIGRLLRISPETVRKHLGHIYDKFGTHDRLLTIRLAQETGILDPNRMTARN